MFLAYMRETRVVCLFVLFLPETPHYQKGPTPGEESQAEEWGLLHLSAECLQHKGL